MDNALYVGLSRQMLLQQELEITANNLANADTIGYKFDDMLSSADPVTPTGSSQVASSPVTFVTSGGVARDYSQGALTTTGSPLDVAIDGKGFFTISTASGPRYTRDGRFTLDPTGKLVTQDGDPVEGDGGDITLDPTKGKVAISETGVISQAGQQVAKLSVVTFSSLAGLSKAGGNLYSNESNLTPTPSTSASLRQGMLESSNVQPIAQITHLIEISRAYDAISSMMSDTATLSNTAVQKLGAVNPS
ncbi:MAG TPA: flagellar basal-body rod protein FlgF [Caulobacteraceae bacterium]|nr:flagellar basal-body rod protein FlgF [Caulobacteraceae bacterium]